MASPSYTSPEVTSLSTLTHARYGKDKVRVFRIVKGEKDGKKWHDIVEYNVQALLEGDIETSYTQADNSVVVATDSIKNITYYLAKTSPHILSPERFAVHLGSYFVKRYEHIQKAFVEVEMLRWERIIDGQGQAHGWSFWRNGEEKRIVKAEIDGSSGSVKAKVSSGVSDLLVLKSTGSGFTNFVRDENTTLGEVNDRIFSTSIDLVYTFSEFTVGTKVIGEIGAKDWIVDIDVGGEFASTGHVFDGEVASRVRGVTLDVFAHDESESVQATLYRMAQLCIFQNPGMQSIKYTLPNKHYIPVDMSYRGIDNTTPAKAEVFVPIAAPSGLISATVSRK